MRMHPGARANQSAFEVRQRANRLFDFLGCDLGRPLGDQSIRIEGSAGSSSQAVRNTSAASAGRDIASGPALSTR